MAASRNDIEMRITADSKAVASGLAPALKGLDGVQKAAAETETALDGIGGKPITLSVNDQAIENARAEIARLRGEMRTQLSTDVNADTTDAQKRIKQLQAQVRTLEQSDPTVNVDVVTTGTGLSAITAGVSELTAGISGSGGLTAGLGGAARGLGALGTAGAGLAVGVGAGVVAVVGLTQAAADAETQVSQLDALTGGLGAETFEELQKWAAATPFAIEDATEATKKLVAAGVPLEDIPDWLDDIGNTASATTGDLSQAATVFAQMVSKGKASYEELQQLAEAGVPVWRVLADQLGLTVAEVQKLATEGKLGADAIDLARESLAALYPTAMQDQAETFNGQMSTLKDTLGQTGQELGKVFLPAMTELVHVANLGATAVQKTTQAVVEFGESLKDERQSVQDFFTGWLPEGLEDTKQDLDEFMGAEDDTAAATGDLADSLKGLAEGVFEQAMLDNAAAAKAFAAEVKEAEAAVQDAIDAFAGLGGNIRTTISFIISRDDLREEIDTAIEGTKDEAGVTLPANLNITQISGLGDKQQELIGSISAFAEQGLEEGARRATLDPKFNEEAWLRQVRKGTRGLLIEAGIDPSQMNRVLTNVIGLPKTLPVDADISHAQEQLDELTAPGDKPRKAVVQAQMDALALHNAQRILDDLVAPATKTIEIRLRRSGATFDIPTGDELLNGTGGGGGTGGTGGSGGDTGPGRPRVLSPRKTPVAVYLDGTEIAHRIEARRGAASTTTVRRTA